MKIDFYTLLGLIKDGKAPKKIKVYGDTLEKNEYADDTRDIYVDEDGDTLFGEYNWNLDDVVIILDEEDEFIDIEEIEIKEIEETSHLEFKEKINDLIKNQKKIIERLSNERD